MSDSNGTVHIDMNAQKLESLIGELTEIHERLLEVTREHRCAVRKANRVGVEACVRQQRELIAQIGRIDEERRILIAEMLPGVPAREVTLTRLARMLPELSRDRLEASAASLRGLIETIAHENRAVAQATSTLLGHMDAMVRQISSALSQSGTYGRCGSVRADGHIACGIDLSH